MPSPDRLDELCDAATLLSPLALGVVLIATLASTGADPHQRRRIPGLAWVAGVLAGLLGFFLFEPPDRHGVEHLIMGPFLFSKWFVLGFAPIWLGYTLWNRRAPRPHFAVPGLVALVWLAVGAATATGTLVVPELYQRDIDYWNRAMGPATPAIDLSEARAHFSRVGQARIRKILRDRPHTVQPEVLRSLRELGIKEAIGAKLAGPDLIAAAVDTIPPQGPPSQADISTMMLLAANPAIDDPTFELLCTRGDDRVLGILSRNPGVSATRLPRLRREVEQRRLQADQDPRQSEAFRRTLRNLAQQIETKQAAPLPPPASVPPPENR